jgi:hypothetical protein
MKKPLFILLAVIASVTIQSCSKTKKTEKTLYKNEGKWAITSVIYTLVLTDETSTEIPFSGTINNPGTFTFNEGGTGSYNFTLDGNVFARDFTWTAEDDEVAIVKVYQNIDFLTGDTQQLSVAFGGERTAKNQLLLSGSETYVETSGSESMESILSISAMTLTKQ